MGLSTHILDTALGRPAADVLLLLARAEGESWVSLAEARTDQDGRCGSLLGAAGELTPGTYRLRFEVAGYFARQAIPSLYPFIEVTFQVRDARHHHIPLLLTANSYTTYRGS